MDSVIRLILLCLPVVMIIGNDFSVNQTECLEGVVGKSIDIPCSFTYPETYKPRKINIHWRRNDRFGEFIFNLSRSYIHPHYRGRIDFLGDPIWKNTGTIRISHIKQSDQNLYFCLVEGKGNYTSGWQSNTGTLLIVRGQGPTPSPAPLTPSVTAATSARTGEDEDELGQGVILIIRCALALGMLAIVWLIGIYLMKSREVTLQGDCRNVEIGGLILIL
ncbi:paired immunoglobulin-like type 2 receptor alpha isoform X2 [Carcharodon carcharias]|uniref:paired immunoglobulin-like type 2 receptor alpha isoform X2 n=1 Tax=Carcharodon carcharias TaxID=13397 RepID=UPI001B7DAA89|nr:paired immunoglobulin-like type 2 receptor alpha isoform X2 [Carcharodon carcharias]